MRYQIVLRARARKFDVTRYNLIYLYTRDSAKNYHLPPLRNKRRQCVVQPDILTAARLTANIGNTNISYFRKVDDTKRNT